MAKRKHKAKNPRKRKAAAPQPQRTSGLARLRAGLTPAAPEPAWRWLGAWLLAAFVLRAAVALAGDFVVHPDEIFQYLEPAHRAVFGNGVVYWEFLSGARSWLAPGAVASILAFAKLVGLDDPAYYIALVKLVLCAASLAIPWGMYHYARCMHGELAGRIALIAGALWPELAGMAHKPMTEFLSTAVMLAAMGLAARPAGRSSSGALAAGALFGFAACLRMQYLPAAGILALAAMLAMPRRQALLLVAGGIAAVAAVGAFEAATWGAPFSSYYINFRVNLVLDPLRSGESPAWRMLAWLMVGSAGGALFAAAACAAQWRRMLGPLIALVLLIVLHSASSHKEYRFIFLAIPLWMIPASALLAQLKAPAKRLLAATAGVVTAYAAVFLLNLLPWQIWLYESFSVEDVGGVRFVRDQRDVFATYRYLSSLDDVAGVIDLRAEGYHLTPGYYYLHHDVPLYIGGVARAEIAAGRKPGDLASHLIVDADTDPALGTALKRFGSIEVRKVSDPIAVRPWKDNSPHIAGQIIEQLFALAGLPGEHLQVPLYEYADE